MDLKRTLRDARHRAWLTLARRGNEDAFRRLYRDLYGVVAGYVAARVHERDDAEDLVATVFHRFVERMHTIDPRRGSVLTWLLQVTRNAVIDHHRRQAAHGSARRTTLPADELADVLAAEADDPLGTLVRDEQLRQIRGLLRREEADIREMFALRFGDGLRLREVAAVMGLSEAAVKKRFERVIGRIRQELLTEEPRRKGGPECMTVE